MIKSNHVLADRQDQTASVVAGSRNQTSAYGDVSAERVASGIEQGHLSWVNAEGQVSAGAAADQSSACSNRSDNLGCIDIQGDVTRRAAAGEAGAGGDSGDCASSRAGEGLAWSEVDGAVGVEMEASLGGRGAG